MRRALGAYAAGRIANPHRARSQCVCGMIGGIGKALMEGTVIDPHDARLVNAHMADYLVPVNLDTPRLDVILVDEGPARQSARRQAGGAEREDEDGGAGVVSLASRRSII